MVWCLDLAEFKGSIHAIPPRDTDPARVSPPTPCIPCSMRATVDQEVERVDEPRLLLAERRGVPEQDASP